MKKFFQRMLVIFVGLVSALHLTGCIPFMPSLHAANRVNLAPLLALDIPQGIQKLPEIIDIETLEKQFGSINLQEPQKSLGLVYRVVNQQGELTTYIDILISIADTEKEAIEEFDANCKLTGGKGNYTFGEGAVSGVVHRHCIPDLVQSRTGPDGVYPVYFRWGYYGMTVQKGRMFFSFNERTATTERAVIDSVIQGIADAINAKLQQ